MAKRDTRHYEGQDLEALSDMPHYTGWMLEHFAPHLHGRVLEVGAGIGNVSARYVEKLDEALLVEPAANLHERLKQRVAHLPHVQTACALLQDVDPALVEEPFDAAVMVNVLEHVEDDAALLRHIHGLLKPGGALLLFVPALPLLYGTLDRRVHHMRRYLKPELADLLRAAGFQIKTLRYFDVLGMAPWLVAGRIVRTQEFNQAGARWYDRVGVPLTRWFEDRLEPPVGKSLIAVAFRPN